MADHDPVNVTNAKSGSYVWDIPTRGFHWLLVVAVSVSLLSYEFGYMDIHVKSGHVVLALIVFRIGWGFVGGTHARFENFVKWPFDVYDYVVAMMKGTAPDTPGHNPLGALSVVALIVIVLAQATTGLFSNDDIFIEGPLVKFIDKETSDYMTGLHYWFSYALYGLIALHLVAIVLYTIKGHGLISAMITGRKAGKTFAPQADDVMGTPKGNVFVAILIGGAAAALSLGIYFS